MEISKHKEHDNILNVLSENFIKYKDDGLKKVYEQFMDYSKNPSYKYNYIIYKYINFLIQTNKKLKPKIRPNILLNNCYQTK
jgi:hypothetical protein